MKSEEVYIFNNNLNPNSNINKTIDSNNINGYSFKYNSVNKSLFSPINNLKIKKNIKYN